MDCLIKWKGFGNNLESFINIRGTIFGELSRTDLETVGEVFGNHVEIAWGFFGDKFEVIWKLFLAPPKLVFLYVCSLFGAVCHHFAPPGAFF